MLDAGAYLVVRTDAPDSRFCAFRAAVENDHAVVAAARLHEVEALEPGTRPAHTLVIAFADRAAARAGWAAMPHDLLADPAPPLVLLTGTVPPEGFDDPSIPTRANARGSKEDGPVLLLIEGTGTDAAKMDRYRGILLPMMFALDAFYTVFELAGGIEVLSGAWDEAIFAVSRWPSRRAALEFWLSEKYQQEAIPLRLGHGHFEVAMIPVCGDG